MNRIKILHSIPFLKYFVLFFLGIFVAKQFSVTSFVHIICVLFLVLNLFLLVFNARKTKKQVLLSSSFYLSFIVAGILNFALHETNQLETLKTGKSNFIAHIQTVNNISETSKAYYVRAQNMANPQSWYNIVLYTSSDSTPLHPGSIVLVNASISDIKNKGNPGEFDYVAYSRNNHTTTKGWINNYVLIDIKHNFYYWVWKTKQKLLEIYKEADLSEPNTALIFALTSGDKQFIDDEQKSAFADSGIIHILAVSGLHVGIIYLLLSYVFKPFIKTKAGRYISFGLTTLFLISYAFFTGLSPSVSRAVIMFVIIDLAGVLNKNNTIYNIIFLSAFFIALYDPHYVFSGGFWLSYSAVLAILLIMRLFSPVLRNMKWGLKQFVEICLVTLAAQAGTFPLVLFWFKQFPKYFFIGNVFVIPFIAFVLIYNFILIVLGFIGVPLNLIGKPLNWMLTYLNFVPTYIAQWEGAVIQFVDIDFIQVALIYVVIGLVIKLFYSKNLKLVKYISVVILFFTGYNYYYSNTKSALSETVIFNSTKETVLLNKTANSSTTVYGSDSLRYVEDYRKLNGIKSLNIKKNKSFIFSGGEVFQIICNKNDKLAGIPLKRYVILECFPQYINWNSRYIKGCVIASSCNDYDRQQVISFCKLNAVEYYTINAQGAFVLKHNKSN